MISTTKKSFHLKHPIKEKNILRGYHVILTFLEASNSKKRKIGYALSIPKYTELPLTLQKIIREKWISDPERHNYEQEFEKLANRVFLNGRY